MESAEPIYCGKQGSATDAAAAAAAQTEAAAFDAPLRHGAAPGGTRKPCPSVNAVSKLARLSSILQGYSFARWSVAFRNCL